MSVLLPIVLLLAGALAWSLAEYLLHRFAFHEIGIRWKGSVEHLHHHAGIDQGAGTTALSWAGIIVVGLAVFLPLGWLAGGPVAGAACAAGWVVGYFSYEYLHWAEHRRAPRNRYERWARRHHFHHHFHAPRRNQGVTSPVWDVLFGTHDPVERIRLPRRMAEVLAPWLLDDQGRIRPELVDEYEVVGRGGRTGAVAERDRIDAFANVAPALDEPLATPRR